MRFGSSPMNGASLGQIAGSTIAMTTSGATQSGNRDAPFDGSDTAAILTASLVRVTARGDALAQTTFSTFVITSSGSICAVSLPSPPSMESAQVGWLG